MRRLILLSSATKKTRGCFFASSPSCTCMVADVIPVRGGDGTFTMGRPGATESGSWRARVGNEELAGDGRGWSWAMATLCWSDIGAPDGPPWAPENSNARSPGEGVVHLTSGVVGRLQRSPALTGTRISNSDPRFGPVVEDRTQSRSPPI